MWILSSSQNLIITCVQYDVLRCIMLLVRFGVLLGLSCPFIVIVWVKNVRPIMFFQLKMRCEFSTWFSSHCIVVFYLVRVLCIILWGKIGLGFDLIWHAWETCNVFGQGAQGCVWHTWLSLSRWLMKHHKYHYPKQNRNTREVLSIFDEIKTSVVYYIGEGFL